MSSIFCIYTSYGHSRGDSGGPLIQYNAAGEPILVGITSFGSVDCSEPNRPEVYVRPAFHEQWLDSQGVVYEKSRDLSQSLIESSSQPSPMDFGPEEASPDARFNVSSIFFIVVGIIAGFAVISLSVVGLWRHFQDRNQAESGLEDENARGQSLGYTHPQLRPAVRPDSQFSPVVGLGSRQI